MSGWSDEKIPARRGHNLWCGKGPPPAWDLSAVGDDPRFVDVAHLDFHLQPGSPAIGAGVDAGVRSDFDGMPRRRGVACDLGAFGAVNPVGWVEHGSPGSMVRCANRSQNRDRRSPPCNQRLFRLLLFFAVNPTTSHAALQGCSTHPTYPLAGLKPTLHLKITRTTP